MKFESLIIKNLVIRGIALSLILAVGVAQAGIHTVMNLNDDDNPGSLRSAIAAANQDLDANCTINFSDTIPVGSTIPVSSALPILRSMTIDAITNAPANFTVGSGWTSPLFDITSTVQLTLNGLANNAGNLTWFGSMTNNGKLIFGQDQSANYNGTISGIGSVEILTSGAPGVVPALNWQFSANTYTGGTTVSSSVLVPVGGNAFPSMGNLNLLATSWAGGPGGVFVVNNFTRTISGLSGGGQVNIGGGTLILNSNINSIFSGIVQNDGNFIKSGTGITEFTGVNTFDGALRINEGGIKISAGQWNSPIAVTGVNGSIPTLFVSGGTLTKTVEVNTNGRLEVSGGTIQQPVTINADGIGKISGGNLNNDVNINSGGEFEIQGGTIQGVVNVNANGTLNMNGGGTIRGNTNINGTLAVTNANTVAIGNVVNQGTITNRDTTHALNIQGLTQAGTINVAIADGGYSQISAAGNVVLQGGQVNITSTTAIDHDQTFDIITTTGGMAGNLPTVPKPSLFLDFKASIVNNNTLQLTADRTSYQDANVIPGLNGIAGGLDGLIEDNKFDSVLGFIDSMTSQSQYEAVLEELAPTGLNGLYDVSTMSLGGADQALLRLDTIRTMGTQAVLASTGHTRGYAAGDMLENEGSYGPIVFGNSTKQDTRNGLPGYNAVTAGFGFLGDIPVLEYFRVGVGISYANSAIKQANNTGSNTTIGSTQGMAYGSATYGPLFLDSVLSAGINNYHGKRNMPLLNQTATSAYSGFQYGAKVKGGFTIPCGQAEISPTAGLQYMHLNVGQYTEKGAALNQQVNAMQFSLVRAMLGGRIADRSQEEDFFPEIHAFYIVDVRNPDVLITSRFVAGGGSFVSKSNAPPKAGVNVGASLTALVSDNFVISGGYDLEAKKSFRSHSASLKFKFLF